LDEIRSRQYTDLLNRKVTHSKEQIEVRRLKQTLLPYIVQGGRNSSVGPFAEDYQRHTQDIYDDEDDNESVGVSLVNVKIKVDKEDRALFN
jgi:hypothetical protein